MSLSAQVSGKGSRSKVSGFKTSSLFAAALLILAVGSAQAQVSPSASPAAPAASAPSNNAPSQEQINKAHTVLCDPTQALPNPQAGALRDVFVNILKTPREVAAGLIQMGQANGSGIYPLVQICGLVLGLKEKIAAAGCKDEKGAALDPKGAVELCEGFKAALEAQMSQGAQPNQPAPAVPAAPANAASAPSAPASAPAK